eukprot:gene94-700_t
MGVIRRTFVDLNENNFKQLKKELVRSHKECAGIVWNPRRKTEINKLEGVQRRVTKLIPSLKNKEYPDRLRALKLPTLAYRRLRGDMIKAYKIDATPYLPLNGRENKRSQQKTIPSATWKRKITNQAAVVYHRVVEVWNHLLGSVVSAPTLKTFEKRLGRHWKNQELIYHYVAKDRKATFLWPATYSMQTQESFLIQIVDDDIKNDFSEVHACGANKPPEKYGVERANLIKICLQRLQDTGAQVMSLTCDGPSCHLSMLTELGANLDINNLCVSISI